MTDEQWDRETVLEQLRTRVEPLHLKLRLGIESEGQAPMFGPGLTSFHIENWLSFHRFTRGMLKLTLMYGWGRRNALDLRVVENEVHLPGLPSAFDGYTILHITDLHLDMNPAFPPVLAERVRGLDYDLCVLTGDYRYRTSGPCQAALDGLAVLYDALRSPVYAILGNHDSIEMVPSMEAMGLRLLINETTTLERAGQRLWLAGVDDPHFFRADNLEHACQTLPEDEPSILLAHSPEIFRQAAHAGFDLMLCGHTHGGQIRLPGGIPIITNANCPRRYCNGAWQYQQLSGYTSVGAGSSVVDVRFNCQPEVVLHRLRRA